MGITTAQSVTVRAETLCDMQVLASWDLETLMTEHKKERKRLLRVMASMLREDLADVTNLEILTEIPIFHDADHKFLQLLEQASEVELARKEELILTDGEDAMFVLLQGTAKVETGGLPLRSLTEGDNFGAISILGLLDRRIMAVRAVSMCLMIVFSKEALDGVMAKHPKGRKMIESLRESLHLEHDFEVRKQVVLECSLFQHLQFSEDQCIEMLAKCEEIVIMKDEAVLHDSSEVLVFVLSGKLSVVSGMDSIMLEQGSSYGELSHDNTGGVAPTVHAEKMSRVMLLWRPAFMAILNSWYPEERAQALAKLETMPRREHNDGASGTSLRLRTNFLAASYVKTAVISLRVKVGKPKVSVKKTFWKAVKKQALVQSVTSKLLAVQADKEQEVAPEKTKLQLERERQDHILRQDLYRLTASAKQACEEARQEQVQLRRHADNLRTKACMLEAVGDRRCGMRPPVIEEEGEDGDYPEPPEFVQLRQQNAAVERKVLQLRAKLQQAYSQRDELLSELRHPPETSVI